MIKLKYMTPVCINFLDHARWTGSKAQALPCLVTGIYYGEDEYVYKIASWICNGEIDENAEHFAILKSTVISIQKLKFTRGVKKR